jgi:hypothetical protein
VRTEAELRPDEAVQVSSHLLDNCEQKAKKHKSGGNGGKIELTEEQRVRKFLAGKRSIRFKQHKTNTTKTKYSNNNNNPG